MKIEKGVSPPETRGGNRKYVFPDMEIGDSVFLDGCGHDSNAVVAAKMYFRRTEKKMTARLVDGGIRIWRVS